MRALLFIDVGPNLGAINRAAMIAADYVIVPLAPDLFSLQGLKNLGPTLRQWREEWKSRIVKNPDPTLPLPQGVIQPAGYVVLQHTVRRNRPVQAYGRWMDKIPTQYRISMYDEHDIAVPSVANDPLCLARLKNYQSLMPMAMEAHKPIFFLKPADGAIGGHIAAVKSCYMDFKHLAEVIAQHCDIQLPAYL